MVFVSLATIFYQWGSVIDIFYQWESIGLFDFILPFLLVFAIVFGILSSTRFLGENRAVYVIIAIVVGLLSLRYQYFLSTFLSELFPRLGIGLAVLLATLILVGMFVSEDESRYWGYGLAAIGLIIAIAVVYQSFASAGLLFYGYSSDIIGYVVLAILIAGIIIAVSIAGRKDGRRRGRGKARFLTGWGPGPMVEEVRE